MFVSFTFPFKSKYKVVLNPPGRAKCLVNYNEMAEFSKSILIESLSLNASHVKCEIEFGKELKTESSSYFVYFAGILFLLLKLKKQSKRWFI